MEPPQIKTSDTQTGGGPLQYSLRTMFIVMTVVAVALSGIFAGPPWVSALTGLVLAVLAPMVLTVAIIYGRGYVRTFCIGGLFPAGVIFITVVPVLLDFTYSILRQPRRIGRPPGETDWIVGVSIVAAGAVIVVSGLVAVGVRWMVEGPQRRREREAFLRRQASQTSHPAAPTPPESQAVPASVGRFT